MTFIWAWVAALFITFLPLWESRRSIAYFFRTIFNRASGREMPKQAPLKEQEVDEEDAEKVMHLEDSPAQKV